MMGRRIGAVLAALVAGMVLQNGTDAVLHALGIFPPWGQPVGDGLLAAAAVYRALFNVAASYLAARLAPDRPLAHALVAGAIGFVASVAVTAATWNMGPAFGAHWYAVLVTACALPCAWAGGRLFTARAALVGGES